jgi:heme exporter protein A
LIRIEAKQLTKRYGKQLLFSKLCIDIESGDSVCVWGRNGSGKSTLLKIFAGLVRPGEGSVDYIENGINKPPEQAITFFGIAAPDIVSYDELTPLENLEFLTRMRGAAFDKALAMASLDAFGIADAAKKPAGTMSSGMKQRLRLAAAVVHDPPVLLLDEPTSFLDEDGIGRVENFIKQRAPGGILIIATNNPMEKGWCKRLVELGG